MGQALALLMPALLDIRRKLCRHYLGRTIGNPHKAQGIPEPAQALLQAMGLTGGRAPGGTMPPNCAACSGEAVPWGIGGVVEQRDVEIRAPPEAPEEWALRGDQISGPGVLLAHGPFQLRLHERPGKRETRPGMTSLRFALPQTSSVSLRPTSPRW